MSLTHRAKTYKKERKTKTKANTKVTFCDSTISLFLDLETDEVWGIFKGNYFHRFHSFSALLSFSLHITSFDFCPLWPAYIFDSGVYFDRPLHFFYYHH